MIQLWRANPITYRNLSRPAGIPFPLGSITDQPMTIPFSTLQHSVHRSLDPVQTDMAGQPSLEGVAFPTLPVQAVDEKAAFIHKWQLGVLSDCDRLPLHTPSEAASRSDEQAASPTIATGAEVGPSQ